MLLWKIKVVTSPLPIGQPRLKNITRKKKKHAAEVTYLLFNNYACNVQDRLVTRVTGASIQKANFVQSKNNPQQQITENL